MSEPVLKLEDVSHAFGLRYVLRHVGLTVQRGEAVAITGANGAGKTTLLRIIGTLLKPDIGQIAWFGNLQRRDVGKIRPQIGALLAESFLYRDLSIRENLRLYGTIYGIENPDRSIGEWIERLGLQSLQDQRVSKLSKGERQRAALARSLLHAPALWLWDEPTSGLDSKARRLLSEIASNRSSDQTIICVTHDLDLLQGWISRSVRLERGRMQ